MITDHVTEELRRRFAGASRVAVLTGAGISAESGVPTFRGGGGATIWEWRGKPVSELSSAELLATDPKFVWEWFDHRRGLLKDVKPNAGHLALAAWEKRFAGFTLVTQNIDGLHATAGNREVIELHGSLLRGRCTRCGTTRELPPPPLHEMPPLCSCGGWLRPDVVLFGEDLPPGAFERATDAAALCEIFFVIGTSAVVYPAAYLPRSAKLAGAFVIEVNPEETDITTRADATILGKAGVILSQFEFGPHRA